jgi:hypothetical protein
MRECSPSSATPLFIVRISGGTGDRAGPGKPAGSPSYLAAPGYVTFGDIVVRVPARNAHPTMHAR